MLAAHPPTSIPGTPRVRVPRNHLYLIDNSGSMMQTDWTPTRLYGALEATASAVTELYSSQPHSRVAVIGYSEVTAVWRPWADVRSLADLAAEQQRWLSLSDELGHDDTAIGEALRNALVLAAPQSDGTQVVLLTDGQHNHGVDPREIIPALQAVATVATVGIGGSAKDVDEDLLREIASRDAHGQPYYRWIGNDRGALVAHFRTLASGLSRS